MARSVLAGGVEGLKDKDIVLNIVALEIPRG
jgi:hypothetical protein